MKNFVCKVAVVALMVMPLTATSAYAYSLNKKDKRKVTKAIKAHLKGYQVGTPEPSKNIDKSNWCLQVRNVSNTDWSSSLHNRAHFIVDTKYPTLGVNDPKRLKLEEFATKKIKKTCKKYI